MAFGKRTDDVIGSVPNKPKLTKYIMMTQPSKKNASDDDKIVKQLELKKEDLFNHFEHDEDIHFLSFESEGFIPIEDDFNKLKKLFLDSLKEFPIQISNGVHESNEYIFTSLNNFELEKCLNNLNSLNLYLTMGFFEFDRIRGPLFFIPLILENNIFKRDYNKDVKFNYFLKAELKDEFDISLPDINLNIDEYLLELKKNSDFKILNKSFIGNFYFRNLLVYNDLTLSNWYNSYDKFKSFFKNDHIYSISEFKNINNNISKKWPNLNLEYNKDLKMKGADKLITNLLSEGNSILYVSNYYSKNEVKKSLNENFLNSLILDFDYNLDKYSIFQNIKVNQFNLNNNKDISSLAEIKIYNENMFNILKNNYSNLNLTPFEIKEKLDEFSQYDFDFNLDIDDNLLDNIEEINDEIEDSIHNENLINIIRKYSDDFNFTADDYNKYIDIFDNILDGINDFESINQNLNEKFGLLIFDNLVLPQYLENFNLINEESKYLVKEDYGKINEFIKIYQDYQNLKNNGFDQFSKQLNRYVKDIVNQKDNLENFNDKIDEINSLVEYLDISNCSFEESIKYLSLLFKHPKLIVNENELKNIVKIIEEYQTEKDFEGKLINQLKNFWNENDEINKMLEEYNQYLNINSENLELVNDIKKLSNLFIDAGFNFKTLNDYFNLKNKLISFSNAKYVEDNSYFELNDYLKDFLETNNDSLNNYLNNAYSQLREILYEIKHIIHNRYSSSYKEELFNNITKILQIQKDIGFTFDNFEELVENEEFIKYLNINHIFNSNFDNESLVDDFKKIQELNIPGTIQDYIDSRINDYMLVIQDIIELAEGYLKENYDLIYIKHNIQKFLEIKDKIGINFNSLNDFKNNESVLDILVQNPKLNYNIEDYELYLDIYKICQSYGIYDIEKLLKYLSKNHENHLKLIKNELKPILNEEYDLKFIKDKIDEIKNIITELSELIKCIKIDKFNEIDEFVENIQILKNSPTFIEDYDEFDSYIDIISFLKNPNLLDEEFLSECNSRLEKFNNLPFKKKLEELKDIISICYDNNTSISLLNTKKDFVNLEEKINKLNIDYKLIDKVNLDEAIDSLKPGYNIILEDADNNLKAHDDEKHNNIIEKSILQKIDPYPVPDLINYDLKSKNFNLNTQNNNYLFNEMDNKEIYLYLKNKNVSKDDVRNDLKLLKGYVDDFNELFEKISEYVFSNLKNIQEFSLKEEIYNNQIVEIMKISCPNSFNGLQSNIDELKNEFENNKYFTQLVESGFFNETSYENLSFEDINNQIDKLMKSKDELINLCKNSDFNLDDTFDNILSYITNLLEDMVIFKENSNELLSLNYLKEYVADDLLFEFDDLNNNVEKLSNLDKQFIKEYFKDNKGLKVKENIKLGDEFNNLIKDNIFTDKTIKFLDNASQKDIESLINKLKVYINSLSHDLNKKEFNLDDSLNSMLEKIESIQEDNLQLKNEIDENSYDCNFIDFTNYNEYTDKFTSFISKYDSKFDLTSQYQQLKQIIYELDVFNEIYSDENYKDELFMFTTTQIDNELLKLKNNLIYNNLINSGKIKNKIPESTEDLAALIDETKELINENDYNVDFNDLIKDNENTLVELNNFNEKYERITNKLTNENLEFLNCIPEIEDLFEEYSIPSSEIGDFNRDISQFSELIRLGYSLDKELFKLTKTELNDYTVRMDLNKEFSDLINSNMFSKSVCNFYKGNYKDKLDEMEKLSSNIANSISKIKLDKNISEIFESDIVESFDNYSEIMKLKEKDTDNSKELIDNYLLIIDKINNLNKIKSFGTDYSSDILKVKEELDGLIKIYNLEVEIQDNQELIEKHFKEIINLNPVSIDKIHEKLQADLEFTKCYNESIFSDKTIKNSESLQSIDLSFKDSILRLYDSNEYNEIYDNNKIVINEINDYESGLTDQKEFLINVNDLFKNKDIDDLLKLSIDSQLIDYEARLNDLDDISQEYFSENEDVLTVLKSHVAFTEIIENKLFEDEEFIKSNLKEISNELNQLKDIYDSTLINIYKINDFYLKYPYFNLNQNSFIHEISFETLKNNLDIFEQDLMDMNQTTNLNPITISLISQSTEKNIEINKIPEIFKYTVYSYILNKFYEEFPEVKGKTLDYNKYRKEVEKIDKQINKSQFNQVLNDVYSNLHKKGNPELILSQKELLNQKINHKKLGTIKELLNEFKDYILSVKPVFMMDINQFYEYISNGYESLFDYVILDKNFEFEELDSLALFLRSKNKLIDLR